MASLETEENEPEEISFKDVKNEPFRINFVSMASKKIWRDNKKDSSSLLARKPFSKNIENLFEEFFVFGVPKEDLVYAEEKSPNKDQIKLPPKILYSYPDPTENLKKLRIFYMKIHHFLVHGSKLCLNSLSHSESRCRKSMSIEALTS